MINALESLNLIMAIEKYAIKNNINKESKVLGDVAIEALCSMNNIDNSVSLEAMAAINMEPVINSLFEKISKDSTELLLDMLKRINCRKNTHVDIENDLKLLEDKLSHISVDTMPLMSNVKPLPNSYYLFNDTDGISLDNVINYIIYLQEEYVYKVDDLLLLAIDYIYEELNNPSNKLSKNFELHTSAIPKDKFKHDFGYVKLIYSSNLKEDECALDNNYSMLEIFKNTTISSSEVNSDWKTNLVTQSKMTIKEWIEFNSKPRSEYDKTVMRVIGITECKDIISRLIEINYNIDIRNNKMLLSAFASSKFTDVINRLIHLSKEDFGDKEQFLYELFVSLITIYKKIDSEYMGLCINYINAINSYINETLNLYNYK